jgi:hypothetical protein
MAEIGNIDTIQLKYLMVRQILQRKILCKKMNSKVNPMNTKNTCTGSPDANLSVSLDECPGSLFA